MEHQEYRELLEFHALDALEASEARGLEEHLKTCAECRSELIRLRDAAALLAHAASPAEPRPEVRNQLLAALGRNERSSAGCGNLVPGCSVEAASCAKHPDDWLRLAAGVAVVALLVSLIVFWRRDVKMRQEIAQLSRQVNTQQHELVRDRDVLGRQREALALLNMPSAKKMELAGTQTAQERPRYFRLRSETGRALLMADGLPATPPTRHMSCGLFPKVTRQWPEEYLRLTLRSCDASGTNAV